MNEEIEYFEMVKDLLINSKLYRGACPKTIILLNMFFVDNDNLHEINHLIDIRALKSLVAFSNTNPQASNVFEIILIRDVKGKYFFGVLKDSYALFEDKYLYELFELDKEKYDDLSMIKKNCDKHEW